VRREPTHARPDDAHRVTETDTGVPTMALSEWFNEWTPDTPVRVRFADDTDSYLSVDGAVQRLDFIDDELGRSDLLTGATFRSHTGALYQLVADPSADE
jgi:hypothetical protein